MTQQFKFGDRVRHANNGEEYIVWQMVANDPLANDYELGAVEVIGKDYFGRPKTIEFSVDCLQPIPHPDTVRLEKIGRLAVEAMGMAFDLDEYRRQSTKSESRHENALRH